MKYIDNKDDDVLPPPEHPDGDDSKKSTFLLSCDDDVIGVYSTMQVLMEDFAASQAEQIFLSMRPKTNTGMRQCARVIGKTLAHMVPALANLSEGGLIIPWADDECRDDSGVRYGVESFPIITKVEDCKEET